MIYFVELVDSFRRNTTSATFAAEKTARLKTKEITMGFHYTSTEGICIEDYNDEAIYTYKSSNEKVVTVNEEMGWIDDVSKGTAEITVTETLDGVSRELGKVTVNVIGASHDKEFKMTRLLLANNRSATELTKNVSSVALLLYSYYIISVSSCTLSYFITILTILPGT